MESDYRKSSTFSGQSRGFLKVISLFPSNSQRTTTSNDLFIQYDTALQMVSSALRKSQKSPAAATCLRTLDMNYSSLVRSVYEALQKAPEELEEGEEASDPSQIQDVQEKLIAYYQGKRLRLPMLIEWPTVPAEIRVFCRISMR